MPIHPQFIVRDAQGRPQPSPELVAKIKRFDPRIGLFYTKAAWAITETWRDDDPRRQWIQKGEMQPEYAFDICGYLPITCSLDEAPAYISRELTSWSPQQFKGLRDAVSKWNTEDGVGHDALLEDTVLSAVSNDLDKSNIVTPGAYVAVPFTLPGEGTQAPPSPFDFSNQGSNQGSASPETAVLSNDQKDSLAKARAVLAAKRAQDKAERAAAVG